MLLTVVFSVLEVPVAIEGKLRDSGEAAIPGGGGNTPEPLAVTFVGLFVALLANDSVEKNVPVDGGANATVKLAEAPAEIVSGKVP